MTFARGYSPANQPLPSSVQGGSVSSPGVSIVVQTRDAVVPNMFASSSIKPPPGSSTFDTRFLSHNDQKNEQHTSNTSEQDEHQMV